MTFKLAKVTKTSINISIINNVHLSCIHQSPEHSHDTYYLNTIFYTHVEHNLHKVLYEHTHTHTEQLSLLGGSVKQVCTSECPL